MSRKNIKLYIIYTIFIMVFIISSGHIFNYFLEVSGETFQPKFSYATLFIILILFGVSLGFEHIYTEMQKGGKWNLDILRLCIIGIFPFMIIIWFWFPIVLSISIIKIPLYTFLPNNILRHLPIVLMGWIIPTSMFKDN